MQIVLDQSREILRAANGVLMCRTHHGFVCANAGVDASNAAGRAGPNADRAPPRPRRLRTAPARPPARADRRRARGADHRQLRPRLASRAVRRRARLRGLPPLEDWRGRTDSVGLELQATWLAVADTAAAAADLARAKDSREPVVMIDGLERSSPARTAPGRQRYCERWTKTCSGRAGASTRAACAETAARRALRPAGRPGTASVHSRAGPRRRAPRRSPAGARRTPRR